MKHSLIELVLSIILAGRPLTKYKILALRSQLSLCHSFEIEIPNILKYSSLSLGVCTSALLQAQNLNFVTFTIFIFQSTFFFRFCKPATTAAAHGDLGQ